MRTSVSVPALVAAALVAVITAVSPAAGAPAAAVPSSDSEPGSVGVRLLDVPVSLADDPRAQQYIIDNLTPGTTVRRRIEVTNTTDSPLRVAVYPAAAHIAHGAFVGAAGNTKNEPSSWTTMEKPTLVVPAHDQAIDTAKIAVPKDAAPGEKYAVIWAQVSGGRGGGIALVNRAGIRVYLSVGGHNPPASDFAARTMTAERDAGGHAVVRAQVRNTGGRALDLSGTLKLSGVSGNLSAGPYRVDLGTSLAPGQSEPVTIPVTDQVADGPWKATLELKSGLLDKTFHARIRFPHGEGVGPAAVVDSMTSGRFAVPFRVLVLLILVAGTALLVTVGRRRRRGGKGR